MAIVAAAFVVMVLFALLRRFGHDELFTFYISQFPSFSKLMEQIRTVDLNPPLSYIVIRGWQSLVGRSEFATRLAPAILFLGASLIFIQVLARRVGVWWAATAISLFWCSHYFLYATEIRPYAQLLFFFSLVLFCWDRATRESEHGRGLWFFGIFAGEIAMIESHIFAVFAIGAFLLAELVRTIRRRTVDWPLWAALLLPLGAMVTYLQIVQRYHDGVFPERFQAGPRKVVVFFGKLFLDLAIPFVLTALGSYVAYRKNRPKEADVAPQVVAEDYGLLIGMLLPVFLLNAVLMRTHGAFFERYCLTTALATTAVGILLLGRAIGYRRTPGKAALAVVLCIGLWVNFIQPGYRYFRQPPLDKFVAIRPELPLVAASGLAFLEMDHYEDAASVSRLHYLTDTKAAIDYAHATIFETMQDEKRLFPIRATVERYEDFVDRNRHFLVFGTMDFAEDWLLRKLVHDGARVQVIARLPNVTYNDHDMYEVTIPDGSPALQP